MRGSPCFDLNNNTSSTTTMARRDDKKAPSGNPVPFTTPPLNIAKSIITNCLTLNPFGVAFTNRGPGIFAAALASFTGLPCGIAPNGAQLDESLHTRMELAGPTSDDADSYGSFSTVMSSGTLASSGTSTPSTVVCDDSAASSFFSAPTHCPTPYTSPFELGSSFRQPAHIINDVEDPEDDRASCEDSDCDFADVEGDDDSDHDSASCAEYSDDEMEYEESEDDESYFGDEAINEEGKELPRDYRRPNIYLTCTDCAIEDQLSFISFERSVHFSSTGDEVIPSTDHEEPVEDSYPEMTCHERMMLAAQLKARRIGNWDNGGDYDPEEHSRESLQLDKELLFAYINGLRTLNQNYCKKALQLQTLHAKHTDICQLDARVEKDVNEYLERISDLLRGIFPNLFTEDEYIDILKRAQSAISFNECGQLIYETESVDVQHMIRRLLAERLAYDDMFLEEEMLEWFAGNLVAPLGRQALSRRCDLKADS